MDRKQKSLRYMQKAVDEIHQLKKQIEELESELNDKSIQLLKKDERIESLENTLRLFYMAIEKDEERVVKEKKHSHHIQLQQEKKQLSPEEEKKLQFQNDMEKWRNKEKRNHSSSAPIRPAPVSVPVPATVSSVIIPASASVSAVPAPAIVAVSKERPMKYQRVNSGSSIVNASPSKQPTISTPKSIRKTPLVSSARSSPATTGVRVNVNSPARQPLAPVQPTSKVQPQPQQEPIKSSQQKPTMARKTSATNTTNGGGLSLYTWCKQSAAPYEVKDFTKSWSDGVALCQLLNNLRPGCLPTPTAQLKPEHGEKNIRMALDAAEKLGVSKLIDPEDFAKERNSMMTYLSQVYSVLRDQENLV